MRLTEKFKDNYWDISELNYNQENKSEIVNKLGQLEDLMEKPRPPFVIKKGK